ncbi:MAG TPA: CDP-diacylglycerol--glycerol-3-phosphate 3-phosphatidyltransferase [Bacteroidota bacterium]
MKITFSPPNQLTLLRILLTPVFIAFLFSPSEVLRQLSLLVFVIALFTDWYDGWVARRWGYITRWGAFLDPLADKIVTSAALIAFVVLDLAPAWPVWLIVIRDIAITLLRSFSEYKGKPFDTTRLAKTKTFFQFVVIYYVLLLYVAGSTPYFREHYGNAIDMLLGTTLVYVLIVLTAVITIWTGVSYIVGNWNTIRSLYVISSRAAEPR